MLSRLSALRLSARPLCYGNAALTRSFAAAAPAEPTQEEVAFDVMSNLRGVPGRYTRVLLSKSFEMGVQEDVRKDLAGVEETMRKNLLFRTNFHHLDFKALPMNDLTRIFLEEMRQNKHTKYFKQIAKSYEDGVRRVLNEKHVKVTTAKELSDAEFDKLYDDLAKSHAANGEDLIVETEVDSSIIGGMVIDTGDAMLDLSVSAIMDRWTKGLERELKGARDAKEMELQKVLNQTSGKTGNKEFMAEVEAGVKELEKQAGW